MSRRLSSRRMLLKRQVRQRQGATVVLIVILMPVMVLLSAFAVNLAYMELTRTEMSIATDAAARAGGREYTVSRSKANGMDKARQVAEANTVAGRPLRLSDSDFVFGQSTRTTSDGRYAFTTNSATHNALTVFGRRTDESLDGPIPLLMPNVFGISNFQIQQEAISTQIEVDVALVIDRSGSMAYAADEPASYPPAPASAPVGWDFCAPAPPASRWRNVVQAVDVFLSEVANSPSDERVSLSTYNDTGLTDVGLTSNYSTILTALTPYTDSFCAGGTNIGNGIHQGLNSLFSGPAARPGAVKVIVVLTDGIHNVGYHPIGAAYDATSQGVMIFSITFSAEADQWLMREVASIGGGVHFHANSSSDLSTAFREIAKRLPTLITK